MSILNRASRLSSFGLLDGVSVDIGTSPGSGTITSVGISSAKSEFGAGAFAGEGGSVDGGASPTGGCSLDSGGFPASGPSFDGASGGPASGNKAWPASGLGRVWAKTLLNPPVANQNSDSNPDVSNPLRRPIS